MPHTHGSRSLLPAIGVVLLACAAPANGQWRNAPEADAPRTASGDVDLEAPAPRHANGRVDLQGVWMPDDNRYIRDLALDIGDDRVPYQPWARKLFDERKDGAHSREDPDAHCLPQGVPKLAHVGSTHFGLPSSTSRSSFSHSCTAACAATPCGSSVG